MNSCVSLLVGTPNQFPVGGQHYGQKPILVDPQGVPAATKHLEFSAPLPLLFLTWLPALLFGSVNVDYYPRHRFLEFSQLSDSIDQNKVGAKGVHSIGRIAKHQLTYLCFQIVPLPRIARSFYPPLNVETLFAPSVWSLFKPVRTAVFLFESMFDPVGELGQDFKPPCDLAGKFTPLTQPNQ